MAVRDIGSPALYLGADIKNASSLVNQFRTKTSLIRQPAYAG
jgi:hypothetical protein